MSSMHLFTDDDDEFQIRQTAEGRLYEVELGRGTWLMLRRGHVEKLHAVFGDALAEQDGDGAVTDHR